MMVDTRIYGYAVDGGIYHPACTDDRPDGDHDGVYALTYLDDEDPHGTTCDGCGEYVFEPVARHTFDPSTYDPAGCADCGSDAYCGEGAECWLHDLTPA